MTKFSKKSIAFAFVASLAAPLAFAQDATTDATTGATTEQATVGADANVGANAPQQLSWNDVDTDKDGALSQTEAVAVPALVEVFVDADANADGALTSEEYQSYVAQAGVDGGTAPSPGQ